MTDSRVSSNFSVSRLIGLPSAFSLRMLPAQRSDQLRHSQTPGHTACVVL